MRKTDKYESPKLVPMQDAELMNTNGGGVPVAVFIVAGGVTVYAGVFIAQVAFYYNVAVGQTKVVSIDG